MIEQQQHVETESASAFPGTTATDDLAALGKEIVARIAAADKAKERADDMYKSAGLQLIKAKECVGEKKFSAFLKEHCKGVKRTRAYELIAIAEGRTTTKEVRAKGNARAKRHRANKKAAQKASVTQRTQAEDQRAPKLSEAEDQRTPKRSEAEKALAEFKVAVDIWFAKMDQATKQKALAYVKEKAQGV